VDVVERRDPHGPRLARRKGSGFSLTSV
jgi:hypothetical protein